MKGPEFFFDLYEHYIKKQKSALCHKIKEDNLKQLGEAIRTLEMGCCGRKNSDGSISLVPPQLAIQEEPPYSKRTVLGLGRHHSCPDFFKSAPCPPYESKIDALNLPEPSKEMVERNKL